MKNQLIHPGVDGIVILLWTYKETYRIYSPDLEGILLGHNF
jgi:hypothetical protein